MQKKRTVKSDILLLAALLAAGGLIVLVLFLTAKTGSSVRVQVDGKTVAEFPLDEDRTFEIQGVNGGKNLLVIRDKEAWVEEASCPDGLCIGMGKISKSGQAVVCLPNRVVVEVFEDAGTDTPEVDHVVG